MELHIPLFSWDITEESTNVQSLHSLYHVNFAFVLYKVQFC